MSYHTFVSRSWRFWLLSAPLWFRCLHTPYCYLFFWLTGPCVALPLTSRYCHHYDFLVRLWNGLNFFKLFKLLFSLGIDHDPPCFLWLMFIPFPMFHSSHDHMAKRSHYCIMIFLQFQSSILRMHPHPHFLLSLQPPHPYTHHQGPCNTALSGARYC